jgi:hypothetical protein
MKPWCTPGGVSDSMDNESGEHGVVLSERITMKPMNDLGISGRDDCTINENNKKNENIQTTTRHVTDKNNCTPPGAPANFKSNV